MSITDIILTTFVGTIVFAVAVFFACRAVWAVWKLLKDLLKSVKMLLTAVNESSGIMNGVRGELSYMRQLTQAASPGIGQEPLPIPPVGRAGTMPPAFPQREWDLYPNAAPAKPEDTDYSLLTQTEEEVMAAQEREEKRSKGIEPELDEEPSPAVVEEA